MPIYDTALEAYTREVFAPEDEALAAIRAAIPQRGMPAITVRPEEGRFLQFLVTVSGARSALEIGTLGGYSGVWIARGLPEGGRLITLEVEPKHAEVAQEHFELAGVADRVEIRVGNAHELLQDVSGEGPFDFVFIDAEKSGYLRYLDWTMENLAPGGVITAHNTFRSGRVVDGSSTDPDVEVVRGFNRRLADDPRFVTSIFPAGDGITVAVFTPR